MESAELRELLTPEALALLDSLEPSTSTDDVVRLVGRLRRDGHPAGRVAAVLSQYRLRRRAAAKFGPFAERMLFTEGGLEQATRLRVAALHAGRFAAAGLEHVADLDGFLGAAAGLIRPGGAMVASTLNRTLKSLALAKIGAEYVLRWLPVGTHDWRKFVRPSELAAGLKDHGVEITDLKGMTYAPIERDWRLSQNLDVNYLAFGVKR